jgi:hypothetical protein
MVEPVQQHFQHKCSREWGYVFENFLLEQEQLAGRPYDRVTSGRVGDFAGAPCARQVHPR